MLIGPPKTVDTPTANVLQQSFNGTLQIAIFLLGGILTLAVGVVGLAFSGRAEPSLFHKHKVFLPTYPFRVLLKFLPISSVVGEKVFVVKNKLRRVQSISSLSGHMFAI